MAKWEYLTLEIEAQTPFEDRWSGTGWFGIYPNTTDAQKMRPGGALARSFYGKHNPRTNDVEDTSIEEILGQFGSDGWELVNFTPEIWKSKEVGENKVYTQIMVTTYRAVFKRKK
jgi:hypothetical protein